MGNLKIPSEQLIITGNHIYKGYYAEYRSRLHKGEFLVVHLGCNGHEAAIPIGNIIFIMPDGKLLQYRYINNGLSLFEVGKEQAGEIIVINEVPESPKSPLYVPGPKEIEETLDDEEISEIQESSYIDKKRKASNSLDDIQESTSSPKYANSFDDIAKVLRQEIPLDTHPVTELLSIFFRLVGMPMDNVAINSHSTLLKGYLSNPLLDSVVFNTQLYKTFVIAYVFIYINNLNIGYPITYDGCRVTPNDNPSFLLCVAIKSKFLKVNGKIDINYQIAALVKIMGTKIVPADTSLTVSNRFTFLRIQEDVKPSFPKKSKLMRFPLLDKTENLQITTVAKNTVIEKVRKSMEKETLTNVTDILERFSNRFDNYISGPGYRQLIMNPKSAESNILLPYIKEYKKRVEFEKDKFYDNMSKTTILNNIPKDDQLTENLKAKVITELNSKILNDLESGTINPEYYNALQYVVKHSSNIVQLTPNGIKDLEISLISANENQAAIISCIITYKHSYLNLLKKLKGDYYNRLDSTNAQAYKQKIASTLEKTMYNLQKLYQQREKRRSFDSKRMKVVEEESS